MDSVGAGAGGGGADHGGGDRKSMESRAEFEAVDTLLTIPFFEELDQHNIKELANLFERTEYKKNTVICEEGKKQNLFHVIVKGRVRVTVKRKGQDEFVLSILEQGQWFGEIALVEDNIHATTVTAMEPCTMLTMSLRHFAEVVHKHPELSVAVIGRVPPVKVQLKAIPFFAEVPELKLQQLGTLLTFRKFKAGEVICRQGDEADGFYYIVEGLVHVSAVGPDKADVHLDTLKAGAWFGEIALLHNVRRTATITTAATCILMYLNRERFERFLQLCPEIRDSGVFQRFIHQRTANSLKALTLFSMYRTKEIGPLQQFDEAKLGTLGELFSFVQFAAGDTVCSEGDEADTFYIVLQGTLKVTASSPDNKEVVLGTLQANDYFGEIALLFKSRRNATVTAIAPTVLLQLQKNNFTKFLQVAPEVEQLFRSRVGLRTAARLKEIPFFQGIKENKPWSKLDLLGGLFIFEEFDDGAIICEEGSMGDKFYILIEGRLAITVNRGKGPLILDHLQAGAWFGEIALLRDTPRTARVSCEGACVCLSITKEKFLKFLDVAPELTEPFTAMVNHRTANTLRSIDLFEQVKENKPWSKLELLGTLFNYQQCDAKHVVYSQGDAVDKFYIIIKGRVHMTSVDRTGKAIDMGQLGEEDHFGEFELIRHIPRAASVTSLEPCVFMVLSQRAFQQFLSLAPELQAYFDQVLRKQSISLNLENITVEVGEAKGDS